MTAAATTGPVFYFVRHGESEANISRTFSNRDLPHRLTANGVEHAKQLAEKFGREGVTELWCSPVLRAVETAAIIGSGLGLTYKVTEALREFDVGAYEGTDSATGWQEYASVMQSWVDGDHEQRVGGGESLTEIVARLGAFLQTFIDRPGDRRIAMIAHGGLYARALPHILTNVSPQFAADNTRGYGQVFVATVEAGGLVCLDWGGVAPPAGRPVSPSG